MNDALNTGPIKDATNEEINNTIPKEEGEDDDKQVRRSRRTRMKRMRRSAGPAATRTPSANPTIQLTTLTV